MNKFYFLLIFTLIRHGVFAQQAVRFSCWSNNYLAVTSYSGFTSSNAYTLRFEQNGMLNIPNWKITVKVKQPILSTDGTKQFPANQISFRAANTAGQAQPGPIPTVSQIGMPIQVPLQEEQEVFLIPSSHAPLRNVSQNDGYYDLQIYYNLVIAGGTYLTDLQGGYTQKSYNLPLEFKAYGPNNELLGTTETNYLIDVFKLNDAPPNVNQFAIQIGSNATNGLLDIKSLANYAQGTSITYSGGLAITANTDYQVTVKSLQAQFSSNQGNTLPLDVVQVSLLPTSTNPASTFPIWLGTAGQTIATGKTTEGNTVYFDIKYSTKANDVRLIESPMDEYKTVLQYEIIPK